MTRYLAATVLSALLTVGSAAAQESTPVAEDPAHNELRALRDGLLDAFEKKDVDRMLTYLAPDVVITVQNAEMIRGHDGVRDFHRRMSEGDNSTVESLKSNLEVDELSILYGGDTAIFFGSMNDEFKLRRGMQFNLKSRWTATLVKQDDRWQVAAFHVSTNMFDNGVSNLMIKWAAIKIGAIALGVGVLCGVIGAAWCKRCRRQAALTGM